MMLEEKYKISKDHLRSLKGQLIASKRTNKGINKRRIKADLVTLDELYKCIYNPTFEMYEEKCISIVSYLKRSLELIKINNWQKFIDCVIKFYLDYKTMIEEFPMLDYSSKNISHNDSIEVSRMFWYHRLPLLYPNLLDFYNERFFRMNFDLEKKDKNIIGITYGLTSCQENFVLISDLAGEEKVITINHEFGHVTTYVISPEFSDFQTIIPEFASSFSDILSPTYFQEQFGKSWDFNFAELNKFSLVSDNFSDTYLIYLAILEYKAGNIKNDEDAYVFYEKMGMSREEVEELFSYTLDISLEEAVSYLLAIELKKIYEIDPLKAQNLYYDILKIPIDNLYFERLQNLGLHLNASSKEYTKSLSQKL